MIKKRVQKKTNIVVRGGSRIFFDVSQHSRRPGRRKKQLGVWGRCKPPSGDRGRAPKALAYSANFKP